MRKEFEIGKVIPDGRSRKYRINVEINFRETEKGAFSFYDPNKELSRNEKVFSASADISISDRSWDCGGQIQDIIREYLNADKIEFSEGWDKDRASNLLDIWESSHLNDVHAGTDKQAEILKELGDVDANKYDEQCTFLKEKEIYVDRGYTFGSKWLLKPFSKEEIKSIEKLFEDVV